MGAAEESGGGQISGEWAPWSVPDISRESVA